MTTIKENGFPLMARRSVPGAARPSAVIFDIDNCLADDLHRQRLILDGPSCDEKYESYHRMCFADGYAHGNVATLLDEMQDGHNIFFVTARPEKWRAITLWWLKQLPRPGLFDEQTTSAQLLMRPNNDNRPTREVKMAAVRRIRDAGYFITRAYDDRMDVVKMYEKMGIPCIRMYIHDEIPDCEADSRLLHGPGEGETPIGIVKQVNREYAAAAASGDRGQEQYPVQGAKPVGGFYVPNGHAATASAASFGLPEHEPVLKHLVSAMNTFAERNAEYKSNWEQFGKSFTMLFPDGELPHINNIEDVNRLQVMIQMHNKLMRYASNFPKGGHKDSARDIIVYAAMLEEFTK